MSNFSPCDYKILFKEDWHTTKLAKDIAELDRKALYGEYEKLVENAPHRSDKQKYFVGHDGKLSATSENSNRREEHLAVALWNLKGSWPRPDGGWFSLLDYQFPLKAQQSDQNIGNVDLLGITDQGRLMVIELKVKPGDGNRGETPAKALMQGLRYAAIVEANREKIAAEAKSCFKERVAAEPPLVQVLAPKAWWEGWLNLDGSTRKAAGYWEPEFTQLARDIEKGICVAVECVALDDLNVADITFGSDQKTPQLDHAPALYPVRLAIDKALPSHRPEGQAMTTSGSA